jgi:hypothetical protein
MVGGVLDQEDVVAGAAVERVGRGAAADGVVAGVAVDRQRAGDQAGVDAERDRAGEGTRGIAEGDGLDAGQGVGRQGEGAGRRRGVAQGVGAGAAVDVATVAGVFGLGGVKEGIVAVAAAEGVVAEGAGQGVAEGAAGEVLAPLLPVMLTPWPVVVMALASTLRATVPVGAAAPVAAAMKMFSTSSPAVRVRVRSVRDAVAVPPTKAMASVPSWPLMTSPAIHDPSQG